MQNVIARAEALYSQFEKRERANGDEFYCLKDGAPEWMTDALLDCHGDMMPDDWRYKFAFEAAARFSEAEPDADPAEIIDQFTDRVDVYNSALLAWVSSNLTRTGYCDEMLDEFGKPESLAQLLMYGQASERREVAEALFAFLSNDDNFEPVEG